MPPLSDLSKDQLIDLVVREARSGEVHGKMIHEEMPEGFELADGLYVCNWCDVQPCVVQSDSAEDAACVTARHFDAFEGENDAVRVVTHSANGECCEWLVNRKSHYFASFVSNENPLCRICGGKLKHDDDGATVCRWCSEYGKPIDASFAVAADSSEEKETH